MQVQMEQTPFTLCPEHGPLFSGKFVDKVMMIHMLQTKHSYLKSERKHTEAHLIK